MRKILFVMIMVATLLFPVISLAASAQWTQEMKNADGTPLTDLAGFNLYETTGGGRVKINSALIPPSSCTGTTTLTCTWALPGGAAVKNDTFVLTAVDATGGESADSNTATFKVMPKAPSLLLVQ